jgi:hypothetical protein
MSTQQQQQQQQHLLEGQLVLPGKLAASSQAALVTAGAHAQQEGSAATPLQPRLLRVLRPKANSLPADVTGAAVSFIKQQQHQQRQQRLLLQEQSGSFSRGTSSRQPGSPFAQASQLPFWSAGRGDSRGSTDNSESSLLSGLSVTDIRQAGGSWHAWFVLLLLDTSLLRLH